MYNECFLILSVQCQAAADRESHPEEVEQPPKKVASVASDGSPSMTTKFNNKNGGRGQMRCRTTTTVSICFSSAFAVKSPPQIASSSVADPELSLLIFYFSVFFNRLLQSSQDRRCQADLNTHHCYQFVASSSVAVQRLECRAAANPSSSSEAAKSSWKWKIFAPPTGFQSEFAWEIFSSRAVYCKLSHHHLKLHAINIIFHNLQFF
ncbi:unnamed protein product [Caenorhabditis angaria]|uniref:Uncharacterized protein n=1 Tax=Caenorhabditis angaria TaxID=860376 RepID=A0A9P1ILN7_9PELO|nr:unnamed protein product [Caenorhabditis angaria]